MWNPLPSPSHIPDLSPVFIVGTWPQAMDTPLASALTLNPTPLPGEGQHVQATAVGLGEVCESTGDYLSTPGLVIKGVEPRPLSPGGLESFTGL